MPRPYSDGGTGGNPAGVVLADDLPAAPEMQRIAADLGLSDPRILPARIHGGADRVVVSRGRDMAVPFAVRAEVGIVAAPHREWPAGAGSGFPSRGANATAARGRHVDSIVRAPIHLRTRASRRAPLIRR